MSVRTYDKSTYAFAVRWIDAVKLNQTIHSYPDIVHRLALKVQEAVEDFMDEEGIEP